MCFFFFFFKQKTAYEIYQCDWSSDVCSSDLDNEAGVNPAATESCSYGADDNCDGVSDPDEIDNDKDGFTECDGDCNDNDDMYFPGAPTENCGTDMNCDGKKRSCGSAGSSCTRQYANCTVWTDCFENGSQTRDCYDVMGCTAKPRVETQICKYVSEVLSKLKNQDSGRSSATTVNETTSTPGTNVTPGSVNQTTEGGNSLLTGHAIGGKEGFKPKTWMVILAIMLIGVLIAGAYFIFFRNEEGAYP